MFYWKARDARKLRFLTDAEKSGMPIEQALLIWDLVDDVLDEITRATDPRLFSKD